MFTESFSKPVSAISHGKRLPNLSISGFAVVKLMLLAAVVILGMGRWSVSPALAFYPPDNPGSFSIYLPPPDPPTPPTESVIETAPAEPVEAEAEPAEVDTPPPGIRHVVVISVDGMRPDAWDAAQTPTLDALREAGAYSDHAQTVRNSITLISHASMVSGMLPEKHGLVWGLPYIGWPGLKGPTMFSAAHNAGFSTAMIFGKEKLNYLALPNSVDRLFGMTAHDPEIKAQALEYIADGLPNLLFIHFPDVDRVGHAYGWMSENQLFAIGYVDGLIAEIVGAIEAGGYIDNTLFIVTADHGGHDKTHGDDIPVDRTIPWLAVGPGVPQGVTIPGHINIYDTAATALYALDVPIPERWDGQPVMDVFPE